VEKLEFLQSDACGSPVENTREKVSTGREHTGEGGGECQRERTGGGDANEDEREGRASEDHEMRKGGSREGEDDQGREKRL
jgi:hypothetical protein